MAESFRARCGFLLVASASALLGCSGSAAGDRVDPPPPPATDGGIDAPSPDTDTDGGSDATSACTPAPARPGTVVTKSGAVTGTKNGTTWAWRGIPYGAPPTGALRFKPPAPVQCWSGERNAAAFGERCPQLSDGKVIGNEDCLTLNVWAPESASNAPVLVFIHGGGNVQGSAAEGIYEGRELAERTGSVVVTMQYRLGALGFFAHDGLDAERPEKVSGNYGILDQIAALAWVKENIGAFGGAPAKVMLFGESAGAQNTLVHVASPLSKGLFAAAIVESGGVYRTTLAEGKTQMAALVEGAGCAGAADAIACLRDQPMDKIVSVPSALGPLDKTPLRYGPLVDGYLLKENAYETLKKGEHNHVPLVIGTNADETSKMVPKVSTEAEYELAVKTQYGAFATALLTQYPASRFATPRKALVRLTTDVTWTCPARRLARAAAEHQSEPVHRYYFTWSPPGVAGAAVGATHGLELPFVFRTFAAVAAAFVPSPSDLALSDGMQGYWSRLAATGSPNGAGAPSWPASTSTSDPYLELGSNIASKVGLSTDDCDFIDALVGS